MATNHFSRSPLIDALKAICCLVIVSHHLAIYGPMSDIAYPLIPILMDGLRDYGRIAVQIFFVIAGFLSAAKLAPHGLPLIVTPLELIQQRYLRLIMPYFAALTLAIACAALAKVWINHESIPSTPNLFQLLTHALLLHDLLNQEALSAGIWYVAIDFQLYVLTILLLWFCKQSDNPYLSSRILSLILVVTLTSASLFFFNRDSYWDETALYFFCAYGLGILIDWASISQHRIFWSIMLIALILAALAIDFRSRIAVAGSVMVILTVAQHYGFLESKYIPGYLSYLGRTSYSIFLVHFPISLIVNAAFFRFLPHQPIIHLFGMIIAIGASIVTGILLFNWLEARPIPHGTRILLPTGFVTCGLLVMLGNN